MRSASRTASRTLCVTKSDGQRALARRSARARRGARRGSSRPAPRTARPSAGRRLSWARQRASATRWRMPPDSSCGRLLATSPRRTTSSSSATCCAALVRADAAQPQRQLDVGRRPSATGRVPTPGTSARGAGRTSRPIPPSAESSPATIESSVLLPQPEAPTRQTNSPPADGRVESLSRADDRAAVDLRHLVEDHRRLDSTSARTVGARSTVIVPPGSSVMAAGPPGSPGLEDLVEQLEVVDALEVVDLVQQAHLGRVLGPVIRVAGSGSSVKVTSSTPGRPARGPAACR